MTEDARPVRGGPYDGEEIISRHPKGFVLVDKPNNWAWLYDRQPGEFVVRDEDGVEFDSAKGWDAAESADWNVIALDPEGVPRGE